MAETAKTLGSSAYERMKAMILDGTLSPGAPLRENHFADKLGISRTPVREAINQLISEGLATRMSGGTPAVNRVSLQDIMEILHVRSLLECEAARKAARSGKNTEELLEMRERVAAFLSGPRPSPADHYALDKDLHLKIAEMAGSALLGELIGGLKVKTRMYDQGFIPERFEPGCREHIAIIDAIVGGEAEQAAEAMRLHLKKVRESIISHIHHPF